MRNTWGVTTRENANGWAVKQLIIWHEEKLEGSIWCSIPCLESSIKTACVIFELFERSFNKTMIIYLLLYLCGRRPAVDVVPSTDDSESRKKTTHNTLSSESSLYSLDPSSHHVSVS